MADAEAEPRYDGAMASHPAQSHSFSADGLWTQLKETVAAWLDDQAPSMGAALAFYTIFSIAPLLLVVIAVAGLVFGAEAARSAVVAEVAELVGADSARAINGMLESASQGTSGTLATVIGLVTSLIGATTVFSELQSDLDRIWKVPPSRRPSGVWGILRARVLSFGLILGVGFLLLVSLAIGAALSALDRWWEPLLSEWRTVLQTVNFLVSFAVAWGLFALIYKVLPSASVPWRSVWVGASVTAVLFTIGKLLIGVYIGTASIASGYGAAGSLIVILVWVYYSAQVFLLGAEYTRLHAMSRTDHRDTD